jgi:hypothetical protein
MRNAPGDAGRAVRALHAIMDNQFDAPGQPYHGTFLRAPEEPRPPTPPVEWMHYDPNWREFIYTTIDIILEEYASRLPPDLVERIDAGLPKAIEGALARAVPAAYSNISLMNAFMLWHAGKRAGRPDWVTAGEDMARSIHALFRVHNAFDEYNSPTYYGPDMFALALWRTYARRSVLGPLGAEMEAALWQDIALFYHAGLRNMAGPYDRSYGMDMRRYVAITGQWIWLATGEEQAPSPDLRGDFEHETDVCFVPLLCVLGARVPTSVRLHLLSFQGERQVERIIADEPRRVATAWLSDNLMLGAEQTDRVRPLNPQFHAATMHWRVGGGEVGWMRLRHSEPVSVRASANRLDISGTGPVVFHLYAPGISEDTISASRWRLPNLTVHVQTALPVADVSREQDYLVVAYPADATQVVTMTLSTSQG